MQGETLTCPECNGSLWEIDVDTVKRYRCHLGHAYTVQALMAEQKAQAAQLQTYAQRIREILLASQTESPTRYRPPQEPSEA